MALPEMALYSAEVGQGTSNAVPLPHTPIPAKTH
jgi:hypothetical protein